MLSHLTTRELNVDLHQTQQVKVNTKLDLSQQEVKLNSELNHRQVKLNVEIDSEQLVEVNAG